jgi:hypothetical protein
MAEAAPGVGEIPEAQSDWQRRGDYVEVRVGIVADGGRVTFEVRTCRLQVTVGQIDQL